MKIKQILILLLTCTSFAFSMDDKKQEKDFFKLTKEEAAKLMCAAAKSRNKAAIEKLLNAGHDINARDKNGWTVALMTAITGDVDFMRWLIENGADPSIEHQDWGNTLSVAAAHDNVKLVLYLLTLPNIIVNSVTDGRTTLGNAIFNGINSLILPLVVLGADTRIPGRELRDPIKYAEDAEGMNQIDASIIVSLRDALIRRDNAPLVLSALGDVDLLQKLSKSLLMIIAAYVFGDVTRSPKT